MPYEVIGLKDTADFLKLAYDLGDDIPLRRILLASEALDEIYKYGENKVIDKYGQAKVEEASAMGYDSNKNDVQFQKGDRVKDQYGKELIVRKQDGNQVFVEGSQDWYHPTKLWKINSIITPEDRRNKGQELFGTKA